ncbi:MAG: polysaccharide pyruvyl transferase family protein [Lawsonibacter sp.]|nr:polysaccharide pyruvyl transferase family protein [Lawsonibacter sp.]
MKYGLLIEFGAKCSNFGDYVQSIAIEYLYTKIMKIPQEEIVHITASELSTYEGEALILPYSYVMHLLVFPEYKKVKLSPNINLVFLGGSFSFTQFGNQYPIDRVLDRNNGWIDMFRKFAPVGCRDAYTYSVLQKLSIPAYLGGCITNILPQRPNFQERHKKKILLVDLTTDIFPYIPSEILENATVMTQYEENGKLTVEENYQRAKERYLFYSDADLIISSRYHMVTPCNAMGVPCIFVNRNINYYQRDIRLDTLNPTIQFCSTDHAEEINWHPVPVQFDRLKEKVTELAAKCVKDAFLRYSQ